jgi:hypothetical protein
LTKDPCGGAIWFGPIDCEGSQGLSVTDCQFDSCLASRGWGVWARGQHLTIVSSSAINCTACETGAFVWLLSANGEQAAINQTLEITGNCTGGSISVGPGSGTPIVVLDSVNSSFNRASDYGSGLAVEAHRSLVFGFCCLGSNEWANVLSLSSGSNDRETLLCASLTNDSCSGSSAQTGCLICVAGVYTMKESVFVNNTATNLVGFGSESSLTLIKCFSIQKAGQQPAVPVS